MSPSGASADLGDVKSVGQRHGLPVNLGAAADHDLVRPVGLGDLPAPARAPPRGCESRARRRADSPPAGVTTMLVRPGSGRPMLSNVLRPMISGLPIVIRLKCAKSDGSRHGIWLPLPITPFSATAAIMATATVMRRPSFSSASPLTRQRRQSSRNTRPAIRRSRSTAGSSRAPLHSNRPSPSRTQRCARSISSALPIPWPRVAGLTNRSSSQMPCRPWKVEKV